MNVIVRLPHPWSGDSQGQETFLAPSADKQTRNYDIECPNHHPSLSTLRPKGLSRSKMKWRAIYAIYIYIFTESLNILYSTNILVYMPSLQKHELGFYFLIAILNLDKESPFFSSYGVLNLWILSKPNFPIQN